MSSLQRSFVEGFTLGFEQLHRRSFHFKLLVLELLLRVSVASRKNCGFTRTVRLRFGTKKDSPALMKMVISVNNKLSFSVFVSNCKLQGNISVVSHSHLQDNARAWSSRSLHRD